MNLRIISFLISLFFVNIHSAKMVCQTSSNEKVFPHYLENLKSNVNGVTFHPMGIVSKHDFQSNAVPNQIWQDPNSPENVHAVFEYNNTPGLQPGRVAYLFSINGGESWNYLGDILNSTNPVPCIAGFENGAAVIGCMTGINLRTKAYYDAGPGFGVFTELDPGDSPIQADGLFPRIACKGNNRILIATQSYVIGTTSIIPPGTFTNWLDFEGSNPETYGISISPNGNFGHCYVGKRNTANENDAFYRYSTDNGLTWTTPVRFWDWNDIDSLGVLGGISMVFGNNNQPYVAFEVTKLGRNGKYFPGEPSSIRIWSPQINGGTPKVVASPSNVPFFPNTDNVTDGFLPICKPSIGRTSNGSYFMITFNATSGNCTVDGLSYYDVWASYTEDGWSGFINTVKLNPSSPLLDWRFISVSQTNSLNGPQPNYRMICEVDSVPGIQSVHNTNHYVRTANAAAIGILFEHGISNSIFNNSSSDFVLSNFPNPFNPATSITFELNQIAQVKLVIYNALGKEIITLINDRKEAGKHNVTFNASDLPSGIYFCELISNGSVEVRRMLLLR